MISKPKGTVDLTDKRARVWKYVEEVIDSVMEKYNYNYIRTPIFEASELFHRGIGDSTDIVTKETYDFKDRGDRSITLRPEGTAGVVRSYIENKMYGTHNLPLKVYYSGTMYRYERPQKGRLRELSQYGVEVLGSREPITDAEVISLAYNINKMLGLTDTVVHINSLGDKESRDKYREALKDYFKPHLDDLCSDCKERFDKNPLRIIDCKVDSNKDYFKDAPNILDYLNEESKEHFLKVCEYLDILEVKYVVDPKIVRGLDYYNHTVFELMCGDGNLAIGAGGRYDNLVSALDGPETACVGFAEGLDRLVDIIMEKELTTNIRSDIDAFIMYVNDDEKKNAIIAEIVAIMFHTSALMGVVIYVMYNFVGSKPKKVRATLPKVIEENIRMIGLILGGLAVLIGINLIVVLLQAVGLSRYAEIIRCTERSG